VKLWIVQHQPVVKKLATGDMLPWYIGKPCEHVNHSQINMAIFDSRGEASEALSLTAARSWLLGARTITWALRSSLHSGASFASSTRTTWSDSQMLVLEMKGQDNQELQTKREFLSE
jgi:type III restriction enzyme